MKGRRYTRRKKQGGGGLGHIYTVPLESMLDVLYTHLNELLALRSKCETACLQKLCSRGNSRLCNQTRRMSRFHSVYEFASSLCHAQLVRMTDPSGSQCRGPRPSANCACETYAKKYTDLERMVAELTQFLGNYYVDSPVKTYITKIRDVGTQILSLLDNYSMGSVLGKVSTELQTKSINDIMQTPEFKDALRAAIPAHRPVSAPSRLVQAADTTASAASRRLISSEPSLPSNRVPMSNLYPSRLPIEPSTRLLNSIKHINN